MDASEFCDLVAEMAGHAFETDKARLYEAVDRARDWDAPLEKSMHRDDLMLARALCQSAVGLHYAWLRGYRGEELKTPPASLQEAYSYHERAFAMGRRDREKADAREAGR